ARAAALRAQHLAAQTELDLRRQTLADLIGRQPGDAPLPLPSASPEPVGALEDWLARAARHNTRLQLAQTRVRGAEQEVRKSSLPLAPTLELVASHGREKLSGDAEVGSASYSAEQSMLGLQVAIPLYTGGMRSARLDEARARLAEAEAELDHGRLLVARQTRAAWQALSVGRGREQALAAAAEASQARLAATRIGRRTGERSTQDLLDAENAAAAAELELAEARVTLFLQQLRLAALAGQLDADYFQRASARLGRQPLGKRQPERHRPNPVGRSAFLSADWRPIEAAPRRTRTTLSALRIGRTSPSPVGPSPPRTGACEMGARTVSTSHSPVGRTALFLSADWRPTEAASRRTSTTLSALRICAQCDQVICSEPSASISRSITCGAVMMAQSGAMSAALRPLCCMQDAQTAMRPPSSR